MIAIATTFWVALLAILYAYVGYPAFLWLVSRVGRFDESSCAGESGHLPSVTLIISAYNEEKVIREKIENTLSLDYPRELLEIVIISDGSSDRTCEIVLEFANKSIVLRHYEGRIGKTACLNRALPLAAGGIIVFSDANSSYEKGALKALLGPFQNNTMGFVTGCTKYGSGYGAPPYYLGLYSRLELITKEF